MAKIVQSLTRASEEYEEDVAQSLVRDLDAVLEKLNTSFQEELKQEIEAKKLLYGIMAVVNQYIFYGKSTTSADSNVALLSPAVNETFIIKSIRVTNKSGSNTPTISITNNAFFVTHTQTLATNASVELISLPLVVVGGTVLKYSTAGTVTNGVDIAISYLNIKKEVTT
jgi:hypothetical protein